MSKSRIITLVLGMLVIAGAASAALYKLYALPTYQDAGAALTATENALATSDNLLIASIDLEHIRNLEAKLGGKASLPDLKSEAETGGSVLSILRQAVMVNPEAIIYVSAAAYAGKDGVLSTALVAGGDIHPEEVSAVLKRSAQAQPHPQLKDVWLLQAKDIDTCQLSKQWTVVVTKERVVAVDSGDMTVIERLHSAAPAARDLTTWREFRKTRFIAAALFIPKELPQQGMDPLAGHTAALAKKNLADFNELYFGASSQSIPPSGNLSLWLSAINPQVAADKAASWKADLAASRQDWGKTLPTMAVLHDQAKIEAQGSRLLAEIALDQQLLEKLRNLPGELIGMMFSGFNMSVKTQQAETAAPAEVIDKTPRVFVAQTNVGQIPAFDPKGPFAEPADVMAGPFGIHLAGVRLTDAVPQALELEVKAMGMKFPNISDDPESMLALSIQSVRDKDGKELLREEPCGRERNSLPAKSSPSFGNDTITATKKVRLQDAVRHADVAVIQGSVRVRLPTQVETVPLLSSKVGDHVEREGLRIEITKLGAGAVSYRVSGETERLLHLRAKNAKGEPLAWSSSFSMGAAFGSGKTVTREFKGQVASMEFVLAQTIEQKDFAFELKNARPQKIDTWTVGKSSVYEAVSKEEIKRDYARQAAEPKRFRSPVASGKAGAGIGIVDLDMVNTFRNLQLYFSLHLPPLKNLGDSMGAAELEVREIVQADGTVHHPVEGSAVWRLPMMLSRSGDDSVSGRENLETGIATKSDALRLVSGRLWMNIPLSLEKATFPVADVGAKMATSCGAMRITEIMRDAVSLEGSGDTACLFAVRAFGNEGKEMRINNISVKRKPQSWQARLSLNGVPNSLELVMVKKSKRMDFPFTLTVAASGVVAPH
jgi:hypothetical protein